MNPIISTDLGKHFLLRPKAENFSRISVISISALLALLVGVCTGYANPLPVPAVWGVDPTAVGQELVYMDAFSPQVFARYPLPNIRTIDTQIGLTGDAGGTLYYLNGDTDPQHLHLFSSQDGSSRGEIQIGALNPPNDLGLVGGLVFTSDAVSQRVLAYPAGGGPSLGPWSNIYDPKAVAGDTGDRLFVYGDTSINGVPQNAYAIYELDPLNSAAPARFFSPSPSATIVGLAGDFQFLYASDTEGHLFVMDESSGALVSTTDLGFVLYGLGTTRVKTPDSGTTGILLLLGIASIAVIVAGEEKADRLQGRGRSSE